MSSYAAELGSLNRDGSWRLNIRETASTFRESAGDGTQVSNSNFICGFEVPMLEECNECRFNVYKLTVGWTW